jgi:hypothetical protein
VTPYKRDHHLERQLDSAVGCTRLLRGGIIPHWQFNLTGNRSHKAPAAFHRKKLCKLSRHYTLTAKTPSNGISFNAFHRPDASFLPKTP